MFNTGIALGGIDPTFDYVCFLFGPSKARKDYSETHQYANAAEMAADYARRGTFTVNTSFSQNTIFGEPAINHAFRFWHDLGHIATGAEFDADGERVAAEYQAQQIRELVGPSDADKARWIAILDCEVNGQIDYFLEHGDFPTNQRGFAIDYLQARGWDVASFPRDARDITVQY